MTLEQGAHISCEITTTLQSEPLEKNKLHSSYYSLLLTGWFEDFYQVNFTSEHVFYLK